MTPQEIIDAVSSCFFPGYTLAVSIDGINAYIYASYVEADTITGLEEMQVTREWTLVMATTTKSQVVSTCFKCILTSMEHKTREWFLYEDKPIYNPHQDVDKLLSITEARP
jgi:hypothetical protein